MSVIWAPADPAACLVRLTESTPSHRRLLLQDLPPPRPTGDSDATALRPPATFMNPGANVC